MQAFPVGGQGNFLRVSLRLGPGWMPLAWAACIPVRVRSFDNQARFRFCE